MNIGKPVYAQTPNGKRRHGFIRDEKFVRELENKSVRWSDNSFCLNTSVIPKLNGVEKVVFILKRATKTDVYCIGLEEALKILPITNEYGEENIRIKINECKLVKTVKKPQL